MFDWLRRLFIKRCDFYDKCKYKRVGDDPCESGPIYFDGVCTKSYCGQYRSLAGWEAPKF